MGSLRGMRATYRVGCLFGYSTVGLPFSARSSAAITSCGIQLREHLELRPASTQAGPEQIWSICSVVRELMGKKPEVASPSVMTKPRGAIRSNHNNSSGPFKISAVIFEAGFLTVTDSLESSDNLEDELAEEKPKLSWWDSMHPTASLGDAPAAPQSSLAATLDTITSIYHSRKRESASAESPEDIVAAMGAADSKSPA
eukprot:CAMPEP_0118942916 /NCGR_PEP_ID=MMETSP1169-20130426/37159_1 /TAXON_ID=36882 /ORGANISM="Pyramimonas obovata, Strain CCMP722" /LENGTH=198 /DNA_ID=CAMNT_0006888031 /DNA_START=213 /DNA_END=805 /DNA_ORIENTATION=+